MQQVIIQAQPLARALSRSVLPARLPLPPKKRLKMTLFLLVILRYTNLHQSKTSNTLH